MTVAGTGHLCDFSRMYYLTHRATLFLNWGVGVGLGIMLRCKQFIMDQQRR